MAIEPLASRIRPKSLDEFIGQKHLVDKNHPIRTAIENKHLFSMILWGPPGVGKTTLARIYAASIISDYYELSAVSAGKSDLKTVIDTAKQKEGPSILFLDEIHRFNKAQQDFLLPHVESGTISLIGATTENPSFEVISPLLSRCKVFILSELSTLELKTIINRVLKELNINKALDNETQNWLINYSNGDARQLITLMESTYKLYKTISLESLKKTAQTNYIRYDKKGEDHYNTISAFIKSMRAGDSNAALYYLARMVEAGEDPKFIARRMIVFASEDVDITQPSALIIANEVFKACETVGYPECALNLAHGAVYLASAKKNRSVYNAFHKAQADVKAYGNLPIPLKIRNAPTKLMKEAGYGKDYEMYDKQSLLPEKLKNKKYI